MPRRAQHLLLLLLAFCLLFYGADTLLWHVRNSRGGGTDQVTVQQVSAAELKRNREEYYLDDAATITCARSLLPPLTADGWLPPCWYLRRHHIVVTHI